MKLDVKKLKSVVKARGYVSTEMIAKSLDLTIEEARRAVKACYDRGLLIPSDRSYFVLTQEDGTPVPWEGQGREIRDTRVKRIKQLLHEHPDIGVIVKDIEEAFDPPLANSTTRKLLKDLVEEGTLVMGKSAVRPPFMGHFTFIFGLTQEAIDNRDAEFLEEVEQRVAAKKSKNKKVKPKELIIDNSSKPRVVGGKVLVDFSDEY